MKAWNELSMAEKADVMKLAIEGGVYDLDSIRSGYNEYAKGGKIHIDPSKKGTFTAAASKHGMGVQQFASRVLANKENYSPAMVKKANFAKNASKWKHGDGGNLFDGTSQPTQKMQIGKPYYSYDENGRKIDDTLNYNISFPEVVIIPDSRKSPGERAVLERERRANQERATGKGTYDAVRDSEWIGLQVLAAQKAWEESAEKKALDYAQATTAGIGIGVDVVSGLPIYSSLKGASVLSRAETPLDYAEGALWVAPALGGAYQTTKPIVKQAVQAAIGNRGFAVSSPRIGKVFGKDAGQFTAWVPFDRPWSEGLSWINTGEPTAEGLPVQYITSKHSGEGRKLYDAVIKKAREEGYPGIVTGRELISAPKTYRTLEHYYSNRVKLDDMGHWSNDSMTGMFEGPRKIVYSLDDFLQSVQETPNERVHFLGAPRYRLETPSTNKPELLDFGNIEDGTFNFTGFVDDPIKMHLQRAQAKGYDTSGIDIVDISKDTPDRQKLLSILSNGNRTKEDVLNQLTQHLKTNGNAGNIKGTGIIVYDSSAPGASARVSHEIDHALHFPDEPVPDGVFYPRIKNLFGDLFTKHNNTEVAARGSQLHDYFGHTGNEPITEDMLRYAREHYGKDTGLDNNMSELLWSTKDLKGLADWMTKYATGIVPLGIIGTAATKSKK